MDSRIWQDPHRAEAARAAARKVQSVDTIAGNSTSALVPVARPIGVPTPISGFVARPCDRKARRRFGYARLGEDEPGQWTIDSTGVLFQRCPKCGARQRLKYHRVDVKGIVEASVGCANKPCDFHEMIQLDGWPHAEFKEAGVSEVRSRVLA